MDASPELFIKLPTGVRMCYQTFGDPANPAVVLISGHGGSMLEWHEEMLGHFSPPGDRHFIIRFDNRDTGLSTEFPVPGGYTLMHMVLDVEGLIDHLELPAKGFHLVGASMGGSLAYMLAARRPQQLRSLTLVYASPGELPLNEQYEALGETFMPVGVGGGRKEYIEYGIRIYEGLATQPFDEEEKEKNKAQITRITDRDIRGGTLYSKAPNHGAAAFSERPGVEILHKITCPAAVIQASKDQIFGVIHGEALAKGIPDAEYVLWEDVGHELPRRIWGRLGETFLKTWKRGDEAWGKRSQVS